MDSGLGDVWKLVALIKTLKNFEQKLSNTEFTRAPWKRMGGWPHRMRCWEVLDIFRLNDIKVWVQYTHQVHEGLTHWGRVTHICVSKLPTIGSDNGLSPGRRQAIIWTNPGILLIGPLETNFSEIFIEIHIFSFKKMHLKMSSGNCRPFCLGLNVLNWKTYSQDTGSNV